MMLPPLTEAPHIAIEFSEVSREFGVVKALDDVSFTVKAGTITTLLGENGAGKSTLLKILAGLEAPSGGSITVFGKPIRSYDPHTALTRHKIALVPQELALLNDRNVAENVLSGIETGNLVFPSRAAMNRRTREILSRLRLDINPNTPVGQLDLATKQLVVVARALARDCQVLVLDEPTAVLTPLESDRLFTVMRELRDEGTTIVYVSHRIPEVFELSDRLEVLRDGRHVASWNIEDTSPDEAVAAMVGRDLQGVASRAEATAGNGHAAPVLSVKDLSGLRHRRVSLDVRAGEILGIAGLPDSGRVDLLRNIFGADSGKSGQVLVEGAPYAHRNPLASLRRQIAFVPGERRREGILATLSVGDNIGVLRLRARTVAGLVRRRLLNQEAQRLASQFGVRSAGMSFPIVTLSGGNQQKAILARCLSIAPKLLILDEPTRGIDVAAKAEIYSQLFELADSGVAIVCSSSDLAELLTISSRIVVMTNGSIVGNLPALQASEEKIMALATSSAMTIRGEHNERQSRLGVEGKAPPSAREPMVASAQEANRARRRARP